jgi:tetratricopeptide (TPR) repeat protein
MKTKRRRTAEPSASIPAPGGPAVSARHAVAWWIYALTFLFATFIAFEVYGPALHGEFLFDDSYLPFLMPDVQTAPLRAWLGVRPLLMLTYWVNYQSSGLDPYPYHVANIVLHILNSVLAWAIVRRLLTVAGEGSVRREILAVFAGGLFLLHPVQTESVAYVTSRSEALSVLFFLAAYAVFLYRKDPVIAVPRTILVLLLFGLACTVKEHTTVLPALLLLTDFFFTTPLRFEGIRRNMKLYAPIFVGGALGLVAVWRVLSTAHSAGFKIQEFTWYQYLFTQFRVIWTYVRLFVLPVGQNGDYVYPVSHNLIEHGAIAGLAALLAVSFLAWKYRREFPLAAFGWFGFLLLLAPTSSVVPIRDVIVERRLYLPFICLLLITVGFLRRWKTSPPTLAATLLLVLAVSALATHDRARVWSNALVFWGDTVEKSPQNSRARFQLAYAQWQGGMCQEAVSNYEKVARLEKPDDRLLVDWALALECLNRPDQAVAKLREAYALAPSALIQAQIGMVYGKHGRGQEALQALEEAEKVDPRFDMTFVYRGNVYLAGGDFETAARWYRHALSINPNNDAARQGLANAQRQAAQPR